MLNEIDLYKTLIKRLVFNDSDDIEIRLSLLNCLNILEYIWRLINSGFNLQTLRGEL